MKAIRKSFQLGNLAFLVVDDNPQTRRLLRSMLRSFGVNTIEEAEDGDEALEILKEYPADIVLCNWEMVPTNGIEFTRRVRKDKGGPNPYVPIIMVTGYTEQARVKTARDAGINEFLTKPVSPSSLYQRIEAVIDRPRKFIRCGTYCGPDRQRRRAGTYEGPFRWAADRDGHTGNDHRLRQAG